MTDTARPPLPERTAAARLIVVIRGREADQYAPVLETLAGAGIRSAELTLSTPGTLEALPELLERFGDRMDIGIGTVTEGRIVGLQLPPRDRMNSSRANSSASQSTKTRTLLLRCRFGG